MHQPSRRVSRSSSRSVFALCALSLLASGCGLIDDVLGTGPDESGRKSFVPHTVKYASATGSPIVVRGSRLVYLADEKTSGSINLNAKNGDLGVDDHIAVVVDMKDGKHRPLNVSAAQAYVLGKHVYLVTREAHDSWDWNLDGDKTDLVLLHYPGSGPGSLAAPDVEYVDDVDLNATQPAIVVADRLYYSASTSEAVPADSTSLKWLDKSIPSTPTRVPHLVTALAGAEAHPRILGEDDGLLFVGLSEFIDPVDLNDDGDTIDGFTLALLDTTDPAAALLSTELALNGAATPLRAHATGPNDWVVAFLVSEQNQDDFATGLNDSAALGFPAAWAPTNCAAHADNDRFDLVLHFLDYGAWSADPIANPPQNTGLAGGVRLLATDDHVATIVNEADDGACDANADGDTTDFVFRWVSTLTPQLPFNESSELLGVIVVNGNAKSITDLDGRFVAVIGEATNGKDLDGDPDIDTILLGWIDPALGAAATWMFDRNGNPVTSAVLGVSSLSENRDRDRLLVGVNELAYGKKLNPKDSDLADTVPAVVRFATSNPNALKIQLLKAALDGNGNGGVVQVGKYLLFRVDEAADTRDWNKDTFGTQMLVRGRIDNGQMRLTSPHNQFGTDAVITDGAYGAAFLAQEAVTVQTQFGNVTVAVRDFNKDGDFADSVVRWVRLGYALD